MTTEASHPTGPSPEYVEALERISAGVESSAPGRGLVVKFDHDIESLPPVPWLADGILPATALTALYGAPGAGKSFIALDLAMSVTTGSAWFGRGIEPGGAMYLAAEGLSGLSQRIRAWKELHGFAGRRVGVGFVTNAIDLMQPANAARVVAACEQLPAPAKLVVIDTLARSMIGDENDTGDMSRVVSTADAIRVGTGATVLLVHHTRKDSELERGSSALRGAVDTLLLCREGDDGRELVCEKQKDAEQFSPLSFRLVAGHGSCIVQASGSGSSEDAREQAGALTKPRLAALCALAEAFTIRGATATEWSKATSIPERTFFRARTWLVQNGYVSESGSRYNLTPSGRITATNCHSTATRTATASGAPSPLRGGAPGELAGSANGRSAKTPTLFDESEYADLLAERDERFGMSE